CVFCHIVSLNPENMVIAQDDDEYRNILSEGDIQLCDGVGIALGGSILSIQVGERVTGADLLEKVLKLGNEMGLRVLLIGAGTDVADNLAICYHKKFPNLSIKGFQGIRDIHHPHKEEEAAIFSIVSYYKPQIIFSAFGSPWQEKWFWQHRAHLKGIVCMGVGGGFDFALGKVARAPRFVRRAGMEWLYRLLSQPWRLKRQLRLIRFLYLVMKQKITGHV
ncbi:MAG: WecB/TagA/CpsF family glycosyltransferase, partial [Candidatus Kaiserbacteria bacterium]|nr:WecB/TagA/CpsF family glycosyltransferase [Candidatus Kaiserbacteria bacterium]